MKLQKSNIRGRIMNIAKWRYKLEIFKVKKFLCVMMLFVFAARVAYSENVGQETKTINNMPAYLTIGTNLLYWAALAPNVTAEYYFPDSHWSISGTFTMPWIRWFYLMAKVNKKTLHKEEYLCRVIEKLVDTS